MTEQNERIIKGLGLIANHVMTPQYRGPSMKFYQPKGGQLQFAVSGPRYRSPEKKNNADPGVAWSDKMGAVFIEAAPPVLNSNPARLDWENQKMVFALSDKDIGDIIWHLKSGSTEVALTHTQDDDASNNNKIFKLVKSDYRGKPQWNMSLTEKKNGEQTRVSIFVKGPDVIRLQLYLEASLPIIMGLNKV